MADKNIQMTQRNAANTAWDNINPITVAANVNCANGKTVESQLVEFETLLEIQAGNNPKIGDVKVTKIKQDSNWLPCDGRGIKKEEYPSLYSILLNGKDDISLEFIKRITTGFNTVSLIDSCCDDKKFIVGAINGTILSSIDGKTWTTLVTTYSETRAIAYGGGTFIKGGLGANFYRSIDGITWTSIPITSITGPMTIVGGIFAVCYGDGIWLAQAYQPVDATAYHAILRSTDDGKTWTSKWITNPVNDNRSISYSFDRFTIGAAGKILWSFDGITWSESIVPTLKVTKVCGRNGLYVATTAYGEIFTSTDFVNWINRGSYGGGYALIDIKVVGGMFIASGYNSILLKSLDGINWEVLPKVFTGSTIYESAISSIVCNGTDVVIVGEKGQIASSSYSNLKLPYYNSSDHYIKAKEVK